jgi:hypothetical protein
MKCPSRRHLIAVSLMVVLPLLTVAAWVVSSSGKNGDYEWFTVGTKTGSVIEHTIAYAVNEDKVIVGTYEESAGAEHGFVTKDEGKHIRAINYPGACATDVGGINDEGVIVGTFEKWTGPGCTGTFVDDFAFEYENGKFEKMNIPATAKFATTAVICSADGGTYDATTGKCTVTVTSMDVRNVNEDEDVVGGFGASADLGFTASEGKFRVLEVCNEAAIAATTEGCNPGTTDAWGVNDRYVVVGHYEDLVPSCEFDPEDGLVCETHHHGFIWKKNAAIGAFTKLYCDGDPNSNTDANGINNKGVIVGRCDSAAFVLLPPYGTSDWHTFTIPNPASGKFRCPDGWELNKTIAWGISNKGEIVGQYVCEDTSSANFNDKSYSFEVDLEEVLE